MEQLHLCTKDCIHYDFCAHAYTKGGGMRCGDFMDKTHILYPKYRLNDYVWTFFYDEKDQRKPIGVVEFYICGIQYDDEGFWYLDCDCIPSGEDEVFATKEEAEIALKDINNG